jgi:hypothetical protein
MKTCAFLLILFTSACFCQPQLTEISRTPIRADRFIGADAFGSIYLIADNTFIKLSDAKQLEFKKLSLGKIASADIQNPLLIVLFYADFNTAVLIDNQLNEIKTIDFTKLDTPIVPRAVGLAAQNKLWVYDSLTRQIGLYDYLKENYQPISTPLASEPQFTQSDFNHFQWTDARNEHFACDLFGKITDLGNVQDFTLMAVNGDGNSISIENGSLKYREVRSGKLSTFPLAGKQPKNLYWNDGRVWIFNGSEIVAFKFTP